MSAPRPKVRKNDILDPVVAARTRIEVCERYGMEIDPRDIEIVAAAEVTK